MEKFLGRLKLIIFLLLVIFLIYKFNNWDRISDSSDKKVDALVQLNNGDLLYTVNSRIVGKIDKSLKLKKQAVFRKNLFDLTNYPLCFHQSQNGKIKFAGYDRQSRNRYLVFGEIGKRMNVKDVRMSKDSIELNVNKKSVLTDDFFYTAGSYLDDDGLFKYHILKTDWEGNLVFENRSNHKKTEQINDFLLEDNHIICVGFSKDVKKSMDHKVYKKPCFYVFNNDGDLIEKKLIPSTHPLEIKMIKRIHSNYVLIGEQLNTYNKTDITIITYTKDLKQLSKVEVTNSYDEALIDLIEYDQHYLLFTTDQERPTINSAQIISKLVCSKLDVNFQPLNSIKYQNNAKQNIQQVVKLGDFIYLAGGLTDSTAAFAKHFPWIGKMNENQELIQQVRVID